MFNADMFCTFSPSAALYVDHFGARLSTHMVHVAKAQELAGRGFEGESPAPLYTAASIIVRSCNVVALSAGFCFSVSSTPHNNKDIARTLLRTSLVLNVIYGIDALTGY